MFTQEWFPKCYALGITWTEFWTMNPNVISAFREGYRIKLEEQNALYHLEGVYTREALMSTVGNMFKGKGAKAYEYPNKPIEMAKKEEEKTELTELDKREQTEALFRRLRLMQANFNLAHCEGNGE